MAVYEKNQFKLMYDNYTIQLALFRGRDLGWQLCTLIQRYDVIKLTEISEKIFCQVQKVHLEDNNYELSIALTNYYFEKIWTICESDILNGKTGIAQNKFTSCFEIMMNYEKSRKYKFHAGTPYFFLGYCYLVNGNLDLAFQMIHNGHMENLIVYPKLGLDYKDAPSYLFMSLNANNPHNYMHDYVLLMKAKIDSFIHEHNKISTIGTTYENFNNKFLRRTNKVFDDVKFFLVYFIMNLINMNLPEEQLLTNNYFSNIRKIELIFDLCIVIDKTLFEKFKNEYISSGVAAHLHDLYGTETKPKDLEKKLSYSDGNKFSFSDASEIVAKGLLENKILYDRNPIDYRFRCMLLAWKLRNFSAHNLGGMNQILNNSYTSILVMLFSALFFATDTLS